MVEAVLAAGRLHGQAMAAQTFIALREHGLTLEHLKAAVKGVREVVGADLTDVHSVMYCTQWVGLEGIFCKRGERMPSPVDMEAWLRDMLRLK